MFTKSDLDDIIESVRQQKRRIAGELKEALRSTPSKEVSDLAHSLRQLELDEYYFRNLLTRGENLFSGTATPHPVTYHPKAPASNDN